MLTTEHVPAKLAAALIKTQAQFHAAKKDSFNPHFKSNYADLSSVIEAIKEAFAKNGLAYLQPVTTEVWGDRPHLFVETIVVHESGEKLSLGRMAVAINPADAMNAQKVGLAITYARRYSLSSALGIAQEDDDGNSVSMPPQRPVNRPVAPPPQQPAQGQQRVVNAEAHATDKQIVFINRLAQELGVNPPSPKTSKEASEAIAYLTKAIQDKKSRHENKEQITTQEIPW